MDTILHGLHYAFAFFLIISVIVFIHEFGHYYVARLCGVKIEQFSIGFGRELFGWTDKRGTRWKIAWLPMGGFVKMFGDADASSRTDKDAVAAMSEEDKAQAFPFKPLHKRAAIVAAGPAANFLLATVILWGFFAFLGHPTTPSVVSSLVKGGAAEAAGILPGDRITMVDGEPVTKFAELQRIVRIHPAEPLPLVIEREGKKIEITLTPKMQETTDALGNKVKLGMIGVAANDVVYEKMPFLQALPEAVKEIWNMCVDTLKALKQILVGQRSVDELGGPIKIAQYSGQSMSQGWLTVLWFMAMLSVNLGLVNLFPIPVLDGGHLFFYAVEGLLRRPVPEKLQEVFFKAGFALVISLMLFTTYNDIANLVKS
ncbi:RIP metalloprotease RseP [bacterium]|nr:RIP metalloprotease RseP [bacterium]